MGRIIPDMPSLASVFLVVAIGLLVMIPTRRLFLAGWSPGALAAYFLGVLALGLFVAELRGPARYLIPILVVAYLAPFVTTRAGLARLRGRMRDRPGTSDGATGSNGSPGRRPDPKNVTPRDADPADTVR